ncbi:putative UDP-rhamnose:rhamnosyltransferase 1 [Phoenix dactylifera]|uniref:UDP-rhamnose:rhamnosyltransferase 1 n=1 Tax=Phoenix dactylifera TaxID=42345 RepID=A0A8B7CQK3_PHODC|nr:putative UDP-rhamnose:rhamnosyltransferase 1 [Phoenix dactylifera]
MSSGGSLHIVVLPWLGFSHLNPLLELSKRIARLGHRVSFLSTATLIQSMASSPSDIPPLFLFVPVDSPDFDPADRNLKAFQEFLSRFLDTASPPPDWILFDAFTYWAPRVAARHGVPSAYVNLVGAAASAFICPFFAAAANGMASRVTLDELTAPPDWVPFPTSMTYRRFEARQVLRDVFEPQATGAAEDNQAGASVRDCDVVAMRSCPELEGEWLELLQRLYGKPALPVGHFPRSPTAEDNSNAAGSDSIFEWLDNKEAGSLVFVAFGSHVRFMSTEQAHEIAHGLELSKLPFLWALDPSGPEGQLPKGFEDRTRDRGLVFKGWAPQVRILGHPSVGGFMTHCGWSSLVEALQYGLVLVLLPLFDDQGLNARLMVDKKLGMEVPRNDEDGSFAREDVAGTLRLVMVDKEGEECRVRAKEMGGVLGNEEVEDRHLKNFVEYLKDNGRRASKAPLAEA